MAIPAVCAVQLGFGGMMIELVLGGARSGKSRYAESTAKAKNKRLIYIATAQALDLEMSDRIKRHQQDRNDSWQTIEEPIDLADVLVANDDSDNCILVDCLTLWLTNCLLAADQECWQQQKEALLNVLPKLKSEIILVSNETGLGIVPLDPLSRRFVDESGWLHQAIAPIADKVTFIAAGLPLSLKG